MSLHGLLHYNNLCFWIFPVSPTAINSLVEIQTSAHSTQLCFLLLQCTNLIASLALNKFLLLSSVRLPPHLNLSSLCHRRERSPRQRTGQMCSSPHIFPFSHGIWDPSCLVFNAQKAKCLKYFVQFIVVYGGKEIPLVDMPSWLKATTPKAIKF